MRTPFTASTKAIYLCPQCNRLVRAGSGACDEKNHFPVRVHPFWATFLLGAGRSALLIAAGKVIAPILRVSPPATMGVAMAIATALACNRILDALKLRQRPEPASKLRHQILAEAVGAFAILIVASLLSLD
jgi:hypothetical protein